MRSFAHPPLRGCAGRRAVGHLWPPESSRPAQFPPRRDGNQVHAAFSEPLSQDDRLLDVPASICPIGCRDSHKQREPFPWTSRSLHLSVSWRTQDHPRQRVAGHESNPGFGETGGERRALRRTPLKPKMMRAKPAAVCPRNEILGLHTSNCYRSLHPSFCGGEVLPTA